MRFNNLISLSATAALLLQMGTFVNANPMFVETVSSPTHSNDAANADSCQDVRITFPASSDIVFENNSKHVVAWQLPQNTYNQVNLTLVNENDSNDVAYLGLYGADVGASNEINFVVANPGNYHVNLETLGGPLSCQTASVPFAIEPPTNPEPQHDDTDTNTQEADEVIKNIRESSSKPEEKHEDNAQKQSWEEALNEIDNYLENSNKNSHSDKKSNSTANAPKEEYPTFEQFIQYLEQDYHKYIEKNKDTEDEVINHKNDADQNESHNGNPYFTNTDQRIHANEHLNAEIDQLLGARKHNQDFSNDEHLDAELNSLVGDIKSQSKDNSHIDAELNEAIGNIKSESGRNDHLDADINMIIAELKSSKTQSTDREHINAQVDEAIRNLKSQSDAREEIHINERLNFELNSLHEDHDDGEWSIEEVHQNVEWVDQSAVPDHSDEGAWIAEEVDPNAMHMEHDNSAIEPAEKDFDHSDRSEWIAEEIEQTPEPKLAEEHMDAAAGEWIEAGSASAVPDHSDVGTWVAEEISDDEPVHGNSQWTEEHTDADSSWIAEETEQGNTEPAWAAEHSDAEPAWMAEVDSHPNAEPVWVGEQVEHSDSGESGWVANDESSDNAQHLDDNIAIYSAEDLIN